MKNIYCVICGGEVPMLEDDEHLQYSDIYLQCVDSVKKYSRGHKVSLKDTPLDELYKPALEKYQELTGFRGKDAFHLWKKHKVSRYGEPCTNCGTYFFPNQCPNCGVKKQEE